MRILFLDDAFQRFLFSAVTPVTLLQGQSVILVTENREQALACAVALRDSGYQAHAWSEGDALSLVAPCALTCCPEDLVHLFNQRTTILPDAEVIYVSCLTSHLTQHVIDFVPDEQSWMQYQSALYFYHRAVLTAYKLVAAYNIPVYTARHSESPREKEALPNVRHLVSAYVGAMTAVFFTASALCLLPSVVFPPRDILAMPSVQRYLSWYLPYCPNEFINNVYSAYWLNTLMMLLPATRSLKDRCFVAVPSSRGAVRFALGITYGNDKVLEMTNLFWRTDVTDSNNKHLFDVIESTNNEMYYRLYLKSVCAIGLVKMFVCHVYPTEPLREHILSKGFNGYPFVHQGSKDFIYESIMHSLNHFQPLPQQSVIRRRLEAHTKESDYIEPLRVWIREAKERLQANPDVPSADDIPSGELSDVLYLERLLFGHVPIPKHFGECLCYLLARRVEMSLNNRFECGLIDVADYFAWQFSDGVQHNLLGALLNTRPIISNEIKYTAGGVEKARMMVTNDVIAQRAARLRMRAPVGVDAGAQICRPGVDDDAARKRLRNTVIFADGHALDDVVETLMRASEPLHTSEVAQDKNDKGERGKQDKESGCDERDQDIELPLGYPDMIGSASCAGENNGHKLMRQWEQLREDDDLLSHIDIWIKHQCALAWACYINLSPSFEDPLGGIYMEYLSDSWSDSALLYGHTLESILPFVARATLYRPLSPALARAILNTAPHYLPIARQRCLLRLCRAVLQIVSPLQLDQSPAEQESPNAPAIRWGESLWSLLEACAREEVKDPFYACLPVQLVHLGMGLPWLARHPRSYMQDIVAHWRRAIGDKYLPYQIALIDALLKRTRFLGFDITPHYPPSAYAQPEDQPGAQKEVVESGKQLPTPSDAFTVSPDPAVNVNSTAGSGIDAENDKTSQGDKGATDEQSLALSPSDYQYLMMLSDAFSLLANRLWFVDQQRTALEDITLLRRCAHSWTDCFERLTNAYRGISWSTLHASDRTAIHRLWINMLRMVSILLTYMPDDSLTSTQRIGISLTVNNMVANSLVHASPEIMRYARNALLFAACLDSKMSDEIINAAKEQRNPRFLPR